MKYTFSALALLVGLGAAACDVCGSRAAYSNWRFGQQYRSAFTLGYQQTVFHSLHEEHDGSGELHRSEEMFRALSLQAQYAINDRWMVQLLAPIAFNVVNDDGNINRLNTLGDMQLSVAYRVHAADEAHPLTLDVSAGIKAPTGSWKDQNLDLPSSVLPGTGSWDLIGALSMGYNLSEDYTLGLLVNANIPTANPLGRRFGPQVNMDLGLRRSIYQNEDREEALQAQVGYSLMYDGIDTEQLQNERMEIEETDGNFHSVLVGLSYSKADYSLGLATTIPFMQSFAGGEVQMQPTVQVNMTYHFD